MPLNLAMLPFHTRLIWLIPFPAEWSWLPTWRPGVHPETYRNADIWKKQQNGVCTIFVQRSACPRLRWLRLRLQDSASRLGDLLHQLHQCLSPVAEEQIEPEDTHPTPAMQQRSDVPSQQAFPYVTHTVESESEEDTVIASTPFGNTLVQHVCRNVSDTEANEAVMNKNPGSGRWLILKATRLQQTRWDLPARLSMTRPAWASKKVQGEATFWSARKDNGSGQASSSFSSTPTEEEVQVSFARRCSSLPCKTSRLSWLMRRRRRNVFLPRTSSRCQGTCLRQIATHLLRNRALRKKDDEEYARLVEERKADEEDFEDYWETRYGDID